MKNILSLIFFTVILLTDCYAQAESKSLKVYSITEYIDGYVIKAINTAEHDTLNIISLKEDIGNKRHLERVIVGKEYNFEFQQVANRMAAMPPDRFAVRIKTTVVWKGEDELSNAPVFGKNVKGLWIKKK